MLSCLCCRWTLISSANHCRQHGIQGTGVFQTGTEWARQASLFRAQVLDETAKITQSSVPLESVRTAVNAIFSADVMPRVKRFSGLQECICQAILPAYISAQVADAERQMEHLIQIRLAQIFAIGYDLQTTDLMPNFVDLRFAVQGCIITHIWEAMTPDMPHPGLQLPADFVLEEDQQTKDARAKLQAEINRLQTTLHQIGNIDSAFTVPASPPAAGVNTAFSPGAVVSDVPSAAVHADAWVAAALPASLRTSAPSSGADLPNVPVPPAVSAADSWSEDDIDF